MKKLLSICTVILALTAGTAYAQSGTATQTVQLQLNGAIEIAQKAVSVSANEREFSIRANKQFKVSVNTVNAVSKVPEANALMMSIVNNKTGGQANADYMAYAPVSSSSRDLLVNCAHGNDQRFAVNYKTGRNNTAVVYTATQP